MQNQGGNLPTSMLNQRWSTLKCFIRFSPWDNDINQSYWWSWFSDFMEGWLQSMIGFTLDRSNSDAHVHRWTCVSLSEPRTFLTARRRVDRLLPQERRTQDSNLQRDVWKFLGEETTEIFPFSSNTVTTSVINLTGEETFWYEMCFEDSKLW